MTSLQARGWPRVDVIKIDIEGHEKAALEGARVLIEKNPKLQSIIEFHPGNLTAAGVIPESFFTTLMELGFKNFYAIRNGLQSLNIPDDIPHLIKMAGNGNVNLFCES